MVTEANAPLVAAQTLSIQVVEHVDRYLAKKRRSRKWLAKRMGVSESRLSRLLTPSAQMTILTMARINVATGLDLHIDLYDPMTLKGGMP